MVSILQGAWKSQVTDEQKVAGIIEGMEREGGIHRSKAISYEAETERRNEHEQGPRNGMAGEMGQ